MNHLLKYLIFIDCLLFDESKAAESGSEQPARKHAAAQRCVTGGGSGRAGGDHNRHSGRAGAHWWAVLSPNPTGRHVCRAAHTNIDLQLGETYALVQGLKCGATGTHTVNINSQEIQALPTNRSRKYPSI